MAGGPPGSAESDGDRYVEIWNLVFMQYNRRADGELKPLPRPSVDTGMGLERLAAVMQAQTNNYQTNEIAQLVQYSRQLAQLDDGKHAQSDIDQSEVSLRVLADHIRSCAFLIADGVHPSNEARGYVLRRIIRRAIRHGNKLGIESPFFHKLVEPLTQLMGNDYPELLEHQPVIEQILLDEEQKFSVTLQRGLQVLNQKLSHQASHPKGHLGGHSEGHPKDQRISGQLAFHLYDTYGFPIDLTADWARERHLDLDFDGFEECMAEQKQRARESNPFRNQPITFELTASNNLNSNNFCGYETTLDRTTQILSIFSQTGQEVERLNVNEHGFVLLEHCPFYAESGGQISDSGYLQHPSMSFRVETTVKQGETHLVYGQVIEGDVVKTQTVDAEVDSSRQQIQRHHTATHLLHWALRKVLGEHAVQRGSLVATQRLRFDFSSQSAPNPAQLNQIQQLVNEKILQNDLVTTVVMPIEEAHKMGAMALFGEKYASTVRVVKIGDYSIELCGGTHVTHTSEIAQLVITESSAIASGIRRIEAKTGDAALHWNLRNQQTIEKLSGLLSVNNDQLIERIETLNQQIKTQRTEINHLSTKLQSQIRQSALIESTNGINFIRSDLGEVDSKQVKVLMDLYKQRVKSGIVFLFSHYKQKGQITCGVTDDLFERYDAKSILVELSNFVSGKGGGRPQLATFSADVNQLQRAFEQAPLIIK